MKKKAATGRPRKKYGHRAEQIGIRVTPKEKAFFERAADAAEMDFSDWVRMILADASRKQLGESSE